jgi:hypothetical protein
MAFAIASLGCDEDTDNKLADENSDDEVGIPEPDSNMVVERGSCLGGFGVDDDVDMDAKCDTRLETGDDAEFESNWASAGSEPACGASSSKIARVDSCRSAVVA